MSSAGGRTIDVPVLKGFWKAGPAAARRGAVLVSLTDFQVGRFRDLPRIAVAAFRIRHNWQRRQGSLGLTLWIQPLRRRLGSLSAWEGEEDLARWLRSDDHLQVVHRFKGRMRNVSSETWTTTEDFTVADAWLGAGRRRAGPDD